MVLGGLTPANKLDGARCLRRFSTQAAIYAVGGGLLEVLVSPIVEHLPTPADQKASGMALLHSFYCWGQVAVVVGTTIVLGLLGPGLFALLMGIGRFAYGRWGSALDLRRLLLLCAVIPTVFASAGAEVDDVVGVGNEVEVVLDDNYSCTAPSQFLEHVEQGTDIARVQADTRFIQNED